MPLTLGEAEIDRAAEALARARRTVTVIDGLPEGCEPRSIEDAYAIQDRLIELLGWEVGGWYCACTNREIQQLLGLSGPYWARLLARAIMPSPARLRQADYPPMVAECEFGFRLGKDLPARPEPYTRAEVVDAITSVHPTLEIVAGYLRDWPRQSVFAVIADNGTDGALVHGEPEVADWRRLDLPAMEVRLYLNGREIQRGHGANVLGDPLVTMHWLANARRQAGAGLLAGQIHNTGTVTSMQPIGPGDHVKAHFIGLGTSEATVV